MSPRTASLRLNIGETSGSRSLQRQKDARRAPNSRENSPGGAISREASGKLAYGGEISPRTAFARSNTKRPTVVIRYSSKERPRWHRTRQRTHGGDAPREKHAGETFPTESEMPAEMAERLFMQESLPSLPGSVPSGPYTGLVRELLCQEDTCHCSEHTTSHQTQSRISELNRIWDDRKSLLADTSLSLKDKQNIELRMTRTGTELVLFKDGRVGDVATGTGGTLVLPPLNVDDVKHHFEEVKE